MKTVFSTISACLLFASVYADTVTLQMNSILSQGTNIPTSSVSVATNQVATVLARDYASSTGLVEQNNMAFWVKDGITNFFYLTPPTTVPLPPVVVAGPALIVLSTQGYSVSGYCTVQLDPLAFPPGQTLVIPAGSGSLISLEASPDLKIWTNAVPGLYTNQIGNLFFRIRADRIP